MTAARSPQTRHWQEWTVEALLAAKRRRGTTVSVVLPARNEAGTIGDIVAAVRADLVEAVPLVDEVVVIDSDSTDDTAGVARAAGARVHASADIRPDLGSHPGKGEAMWKSLFATRGDVLVFMDADLTGWGTHFVTGLLGPALTDERVELVKGFYDRPFAADAGGPTDEVPSEGGRVTELVARPLLALHWPELAGVIQPLAGEWAVRRTLLEQVPVPTGYAVDLSALLDAYKRCGLDAVAQVDLGLRRHGHQPLRDLGAMSLQIMAMVEERLGGTPREALTLRQFGWGVNGAVARDRRVGFARRPPAAEVPVSTGVGGRQEAAC